MTVLCGSKRALSRWLLRPRITTSTTTTTTTKINLPPVIRPRHLSSLNQQQDDEEQAEQAKGIGDVNVDGLISGVTTDMAKNDPVLAAYIRANFPEKFITEEDIAATQHIITNWGELRRTAPKPPLNVGSFDILMRCQQTEEGSNRCFPMRRRGYIPGLIYGGDPNQGISGRDLEARIFIKTPSRTLQSEMDRYRHAFASRVYDVTVYEDEEHLAEAMAAKEAAKGNNDGDDEIDDAADYGGITHRVLPRDVQQHPVNDMVYCCNYLRYYPGRPIKIPLTLINEEESPALKRDGYLIPINRYCEVIVEEGVDIPEELEVECTGLQFKQVIRLDRIAFPDGVKPSYKVLKHNDWMVGPIHGGKGGGVDDDAEGAEGEEED